MKIWPQMILMLLASLNPSLVLANEQCLDELAKVVSDINLQLDEDFKYEGPDGKMYFGAQALILDQIDASTRKLEKAVLDIAMAQLDHKMNPGAMAANTPSFLENFQDPNLGNNTWRKIRENTLSQSLDYQRIQKSGDFDLLQNERLLKDKHRKHLSDFLKSITQSGQSSSFSSEEIDGILDSIDELNKPTGDQTTRAFGMDGLDRDILRLFFNDTVMNNLKKTYGTTVPLDRDRLAIFQGRWDQLYHLISRRDHRRGMGVYKEKSTLPEGLSEQDILNLTSTEDWELRNVDGTYTQRDSKFFSHFQAQINLANGIKKALNLSVLADKTCGPALAQGFAQMALSNDPLESELAHCYQTLTDQRPLNENNVISYLAKFLTLSQSLQQAAQQTDPAQTVALAQKGKLKDRENSIGAILSDSVQVSTKGTAIAPQYDTFYGPKGQGTQAEGEATDSEEEEPETQLAQEDDDCDIFSQEDCDETGTNKETERDPDRYHRFNPFVAIPVPPLSPQFFGVVI